MSENTTLSESPDGQRKRYEPPAIEQSAGFERVMFSCALIPDDPDCLLLGEGFSSAP